MAAGRLDRVTVALLDKVGRRLWGFPPRLTGPIVGQLGALRALVWSVRNMRRYERTLQTLGPLRTHLVCVAISLRNGCSYSAYGHAYAVELVYFRERGRLFPVDARTISGWTGLPVGELRERLHSMLQEADLHPEVLWIDRTLALTGDAQPADQDEVRIAHLVGMFGVINAVGIASRTPPDEAHDRLNKDGDLKDRLLALRGSAADPHRG